MMKPKRIADLLLERYRQDGAVGIFRQIISRALYFAHWRLHDVRRDRRETHQTSPFYVVNEEELLGSVPAERERVYRPFPRLTFRWSVDSLGIEPAEFTFVDVGSGRGRILLAAAELGFRKVLGLEYARTLHEEACRNIADYPQERLSTDEIASLHVDAKEYEFPPGNLVAFFFNPFKGHALDKVVRELIESSRRSDRMAYIIYAADGGKPPFRNEAELEHFKLGFSDRLKLRTLSPFPVDIYRIDISAEPENSAAGSIICRSGL
ncbi:MAG: hypothetical protein GC182_05330 [Rhodopseudomonas sp.]|nr:hypothetical protein [Rhodopseudomonas sp.]